MKTVSLVVVVVYGSIGRLLAVHCVTAVKTGVDEEEATRLTAGGAQLILVSIDREGGSKVRRDRSFWTLTTRAGGSMDAGDEVDAVARLSREVRASRV